MTGMGGGRGSREVRNNGVSPQVRHENEKSADDLGGAIGSFGRQNAIAVMAEAALTFERARVRYQVRLKHLAKRGNTCEHSEQLLKRSQEIEDWVDESLAKLIRAHPAAAWFMRVKGIGGENIGKVIGHIEAFGKYYAPGDPLIPPHVKREPEPVFFPSEEDPEVLVARPMVWVEGIERLVTPSKLRKYAGMAPHQKRLPGQKLSYNSDLRLLLWRLGGSLLKATGKYYEFYGDYKARLERRLASQGIKILPVPKNRFCGTCQKEVALKKARFCPDCLNPLGLKAEPPGVVWKGHVHQMAQHRMTQLFLDHLWVAWRRSLGLPLRDPYPIEYLGHTQIITPEMMCDR